MQNKIEDLMFMSVEKITGYSQKELIGRSRLADLIKARHICYYLLKEKTSYSLALIGHIIGHRDHSSVLHGIKKINEQWLDVPKFYKSELALLDAIENEMDWHIKAGDYEVINMNGTPLNKEVVSLINLSNIAI